MPKRSRSSLSKKSLVRRGVLNTMRDGSLMISHREYCLDVLGTTAFNNTSFLINPGNEVIFPWLSQCASDYDEFQFFAIKFVYKSITGDLGSTTVQTGTVVMSTNYNPGQTAFNSKQTMLEYEGTNSGKITEDIVHYINCIPSANALGGVLYNPPNGTIPTGEDLKTYNLALFQLATINAANTGQIGELWVEYTVQLRKSKIYSLLGGLNNTLYLSTAVSTSSSQLFPAALVASFISGFTLSNLQTYALITPSGNNIQVSTNGANVLHVRFPDTLNSGTYAITVYVVGTTFVISTTDVSVNATVPGNISPLPTLAAKTSYAWLKSTTEASYKTIVNITSSAISNGTAFMTAGGTFVNIPTVASSASITGCVLKVEQLNGPLVNGLATYLAY